MAYRHRGGQIVFDVEGRLYRWRVSRKVVGRREQVTAAALGVIRELGAPSGT